MTRPLFWRKLPHTHADVSIFEIYFKMRNNASTESHFPSRLKTAREAKGLSQRELAKRVDSSPTAMSEFEKGKRTPGTWLIERMAAELEVSVDFLLGRSTAEDAYPPEVEELAKIASQLTRDDIVMLISLTRALVDHRKRLGEPTSEEEGQIAAGDISPE